MKGANIFKIVASTLFILFIALYFTQTTEYYEFEQKRRTSLTNEQIKEFEQAIKDGKNVDIETYFKKDIKDYNNKVSKMGLAISDKIETTFKEGIKFLFKTIGEVVNE